MIPNDKLDSHNQALGFPAPQPVILVKVECESQKHCVQFFKDLEVANAISGAAEFGDACMFSVDELTRIDQGSVSDATTWVGIMKRPSNLSTVQFYKKLEEEIVDQFVNLPVVQTHLLKHTLLLQNDAMAGEWHSLGVSAEDPFALIIFHGEWDGMMEIAVHDGVKQVADEMENVNLNATLTCFSADIVTKLDKN
ncbi:hypothetical protein C8R47DRAFT_1153890 [Mycena vitilis]|nr:hypothetical protein C8R47DRAFT_1153890 [Mycena vitilis]